MSRERIGDVAEILLDYFEHKKTYQAEKIMTVPAASYTDADQARAERDLIFKRLPLMLALTCEMPKPGDYKAMEVEGIPILIARDKIGTVRAFLNVCAHRWSPVIPEGYGSRPRCNFTCPFHGWTYGADGKLIGIADPAKFGDIDRSKHGLRELPCEERLGMIFVCPTPGMSLDLDSYYGALLDEYADFGLQDWTFLASSVLEGPNWKGVWTNFFESYHIATQHPKTVGLYWVSNLNHYEGFGPHMRVGFALHEIAKLREVPREQWSQQEGRAFSFMRYFFPNVVGALSLSGLSTFIQVFPGATPATSRVVVLYIRKEPLKNEADREKVEKELELVIKLGDDTLRDEDFATGIATQKGLESDAHEGLLYGRNERGPQYFHEWVNWYLEGDSTLPKPVM
jgi:phenylpropionate dioxygenase-like ring-hydroxylating dioxygenase large terminal subunit